MRILLVINSPPLPFGSADARWYYVLLKELVNRGHQVTAFAACANTADLTKAKAIFPDPDYDLRCYPIVASRTGLAGKFATFREPYSYIFSSDFRHDLAQELAQPYDILHLEQLWSGWLGLAHRERALINIHYLHSLDGNFNHDSSWENRLRKLMTDRAEAKLLQAYPHITSLSDRLSQEIRSVNPQGVIHTVPLGIDLSLYPFITDQQINPQPIIGLIGSFEWGPSYSAAERLITRLWPEIQRRVPGARLQIVGRNAQRALANFTDIDGLEIYQDVPDTLPYFGNLDVMLYAPVAGSGMKVKVMEAFALGTPVVTTGEGVEGIPARDRVHAGICEDDRGLIDRTVELLTDRLRSQQLRFNARKLLEDHCRPGVTVGQIEKIYTQIVNQ
jgi:glycosyltransferase involved in cell wall biosynthesis